MARIGFIGLGAMGSRMARRLLDARHDLIVWNRSPEKAVPLADAGAAVAATPADAARDAEVVMTMLADPDALAAVTGGLVAGAHDGLTVVEMSTVGPAAIARLRESLPASTGLIDAPVLGSLSEAESGSLRIFVGGDEALGAKILPVLSALGTPLRVGPLGSGARAKLVANLTLFGSLGVLGEALALGQGLGLSRDVVFNVLAGTPIASQAERRHHSLETGEYPLRFTLDLARKDIDLILQAAADAGVDLRLIPGAQRWLADAQEQGRGALDYATVLETILGNSRHE